MLAADVRWPANGRASWMRASNGMDRAAQRVDRQRRGDVGRARELFGAGQRQRQHRRRRLRAVDQREPFLGAEADRRQPGAPQRLGARRSTEPQSTLSSQRSCLFFRDLRDLCGFCLRRRRQHLALADQHERQMRERREVAARADRAARRHARVDAAVQQRDQRLERLDADAGEPFRQHVGAQRHRRAHGADRQRIAERRRRGCAAG